MPETMATKRWGQGRNVNESERLASLVGGGALIAYGLAKRNWNGWTLAAVGVPLLYRGVTGHCDMYQALGINTARRSGRNVSIPYELGIRVDETVSINKPPEDVYRYWRNLENLPRFMTNVESVREIDNKHSHWVVKGPGGSSVEWEAEIINEKENELIAWRSLHGSEVSNAGSVQFRSLGDRGTEVRIELQYEPPGGTLGAAFAKLMGRNPSRQIAEDLRRLKALMETGEIATIKGQPSGRRSTLVQGRDALMHSAKSIGKQRPAQKGWNRDVVATASEDSFPASDPPSWTPERV